MKKQKIASIFQAVLAAVLYAVNMPFSKLLLRHIPSTLLAGLLYIGAGVGMGILFLLRKKDSAKDSLLSKADLPYTIGMVLLDIAAPIFLLYGLSHTASANASLLNNFEIVATTIIALVIFKETVSKRLWCAVLLVTISSIILTFEDVSGLKFSYGSFFVLLAAVCWGFENNCTRNISDKNTYQIVTIKGICSGLGSLVIGLFLGERFPEPRFVLAAVALGYVAYGLSIFFYIKAQNGLGAAKTSAYYAIAPFVGAVLSFVILKEALTVRYLIALLFMIAGSVTVTADALILQHQHLHTHRITHTHDGVTHTHEITHSHPHSHKTGETKHHHTHKPDEILHQHAQ